MGQAISSHHDGSIDNNILSISNDYELAIKTSKELEHLLETEFHGVGRGLHEKITSAEPHLGGSQDLVRDMRYLATIRNKLIHERGFDVIPDRARFIARYQKSAQELHDIVVRNKRRAASGSASACVVS